MLDRLRSIDILFQKENGVVQLDVVQELFIIHIRSYYLCRALIDIYYCITRSGDNTQKHIQVQQLHSKTVDTRQ